MKNSPKDTNFLTLPDGRKLCYAEYGDPEGKPVILFHGYRFGIFHLPLGAAFHTIRLHSITSFLRLKRKPISAWMSIAR